MVGRVSAFLGLIRVFYILSLVDLGKYFSWNISTAVYRFVILLSSNIIHLLTPKNPPTSYAYYNIMKLQDRSYFYRFSSFLYERNCFLCTLFRALLFALLSRSESRLLVSSDLVTHYLLAHEID